MSYYFFLGTMQLPVPPSRMDIRVGNQNRTINLIDGGEINIIKSPGLKTIRFDAMFPNNVYPFADYSSSLTGTLVSALLGNSATYKSSSSYLSQIQTLKTNKTAVRFIVTRIGTNFSLLFDTNILVTVEDCTMQEDAARNGTDVVMSLTLKEYKEYGTKEVEATTNEDGSTTLTVKQDRQTDKTVANAWTVTSEKSVMEAVKLASGGNLNWRQVANLNGITNPNAALSKGTVLYLG